MRQIFTPDAPRPAGHYSQAIVCGDTVYVSGQLAVDPVTGEKVVMYRRLYKNINTLFVKIRLYDTSQFAFELVVFSASILFKH